MVHTTLCYIEKDDKYLMLHRTKKENDINEGKWIGIGGKFEAGESAEQCVLREVKEETGLTLTKYSYRAEILFCPGTPIEETMHLFTATDFEGNLNKDCPEGELCWLEKEKLLNLPHWEGDKIFLNLIQNPNHPFFKLTLCYEGSKLTQAILNGKDMIIS